MISLMLALLQMGIGLGLVCVFAISLFAAVRGSK